MYLVNTHLLELEEYDCELDATYCTLSHRWLPAKQEVSFQDIAQLSTCQKEGVTKLRSACRIARSLKFDYIWIDTCCIDKSSSAALSEAINSMWKYYETSQVCLAYLADFVIGDSERTFEHSSWFTRSWTLQELLAPMEVIFFDANWHEFGTRSSLSSLISCITGIYEPALHGIDPARYSIAHRMSWAAAREATRTEDLAYSLMGLFNVNMPMIYGEGAKAFRRLQEEIIKQSDDQSIFVWSSASSTFSSGLLASSPSNFANCHYMNSSAFGAVSPTFSLSSRGVEIDLGTVPVSPDEGNGIFKALLEVVLVREGAEDLCVGIYLGSVKGPCNFRHRIAHRGEQLWICPYSELSREFFRKQRYCVRGPGHVFKYRSRRRTWFETPTVTDNMLGDLAPKIYWNGHCEVSDLSSCAKSGWLSYRESNPICTVDLTSYNIGVQFVHFGFDDTLRPVCFITDSSYVHIRRQDHQSLKRPIADVEEDHPDSNGAVVHESTKTLACFLPRLDALQNVEVEYFFNLPWSLMDMRGLIPHIEHHGCWAVIGEAGQDLRFLVDSTNVQCADLDNHVQYKLSVSLVQKKIDFGFAWTLHIDMLNRPPKKQG